MSTRRYPFFIRMVCGLTIALLLIVYALRTNMDFFYTPGEILDNKERIQATRLRGQPLRVGGMVQANSVIREANNLVIRFKIYDARGALTILYHGILPDLFREESSVIALGQLISSDTLLASEILAKHDENYRPKGDHLSGDNYHFSAMSLTQGESTS